jgi:two-component sensor histidine kinase
MTDENRISHILSNLIELASGNFDISDLEDVSNDSIDAIDRGVFMLGEQLKADRLKQKQLIIEKEALIKEVHHRVKNNLQVITSLLSLQSNEIDNDRAKEIFLNSQNRIKSMAIIHEMLYKSSNLKQVDYENYTQKLIKNLINLTNNKLEFKLDIEDIILNINTSIPLGLVINEIVTNSIKHGFKDSEKGIISIEIKNISDTNYALKIGDNGIGNIKEWEDQENSSLGLSLIDILIDQLNGTIQMDFEKKGINYIITFQELN